MWISYLLHQLGIESSRAMKLWFHDWVATHIATNPNFHEPKMHIEVDCHFVRKKIRTIYLLKLFLENRLMYL